MTNTDKGDIIIGIICGSFLIALIAASGYSCAARSYQKDACKRAEGVVFKDTTDGEYRCVRLPVQFVPDSQWK